MSQPVDLILINCYFLFVLFLPSLIPLFFVCPFENCNISMVRLQENKIGFNDLNDFVCERFTKTL